MTTTPAGSVAGAAVPVAARAGSRVGGLRLAAPIVSHTGVDVLSAAPIALIPILNDQIGMTPAQKAMFIGVGSLSSGLVQPLVALWQDKHDSRLIGTVGVALAGVAMGLLGFSTTFGQALMLYMVGMLGVGAFHPAAAAATGHMAGPRRSAAVSIFFLAGMIGGISGNLGAPALCRWIAGMVGGEAGAGVVEAASGAAAASAASAAAAAASGLRWLLPIWLVPALLLTGYLAWAIHGLPHAHAGARDDHAQRSKRERGVRWWAVWVLYLGNAFRFTVNNALIYLMVQWAEAHTRTAAGAAEMSTSLALRASGLNGLLQAAMQVGMGVGGLALGFWLSKRLMKSAFVGLPLVGAGAIACVPLVDGVFEAWGPMWVAAGAWGLIALSGVGFGAVLPVSIALGQRLLPHRTSLVSGLLMGGAWTPAFVGPALASALDVGAGEHVWMARPLIWAGLVPEDGYGLEVTFVVTGAALAVSGLVGALLPGRLVKTV